MLEKLLQAAIITFLLSLVAKGHIPRSAQIIPAPENPSIPTSKLALQLPTKLQAYSQFLP
jgi:hypothetical protein